MSGSASPSKVRLAVFAGGVHDTIPNNASATWPDDLLVWHSIERPEQKTSVAAFTPGVFRPGLGRAGGATEANLDCMTALVLDYDEKHECTIERAEAAFAGLEHVIYTTASHAPEAHRFRVVFPLTRALPVHEYKHAQAWLAKLASDKGVSVGPALLPPSQLYFFATKRTDEDFHPVAYRTAGDVLDPDAIWQVAGPPPAEPMGRIARGGKVDLQVIMGGAGASAEASAPFAGVEHTSDPVERLDCIEPKCAFMAHCRENAETLTEPEWQPWLSVLNRCIDGRKHAHEIGKVHPTYSEAGTNAKMDRLLEDIGGKPMTCEQIRKRSDACQGCTLGKPHGDIVTPAQFGRPDPKTATPEAVAEDYELRAKNAVAAAQALHAQMTAVMKIAADNLIEAKAARSDVIKFAPTLEEKQKAEQQVAEAKSKADQAKADLKRAEKALNNAERQYNAFNQALERDVDPRAYAVLNWDRFGTSPLGNKTNLRTILTLDVVFEDLRYDLFAERLLYGEDEAPAQDTPRAIDIESRYQMQDLKTSTYREVALMVGHLREFHPVRNYLGGLVWDGVDRLANLMVRGFGSTSDVPGYLEDVGRKLCISAVARIYQPGCKVDEVVVLTGKEGVKKSTSLRVLASGWFSDAHIDIKSKDGLMALAGQWFFELAELDSVKKAEHTAVRRFISSQIDRYRPPYGASMVDRPRQGILVASTNEPEFLTDPHGSRRFVPVPVHQTDPDWIAENLDQLWAEAVVLYRQGIPWHYFEGDGSKERLKNASEQHRSEEPWRPKIEAYLYDKASRATPDLVSPLDILTSPLCLEKPVYQVNRNDKSTVIRILEDLGCTAYQPPAKNGARPSRMYRVPVAYLNPNEQSGSTKAPLFPGQGGQHLPVDFGAPRKSDT